MVERKVWKLFINQNGDQNGSNCIEDFVRSTIEGLVMEGCELQTCELHLIYKDPNDSDPVGVRSWENRLISDQAVNFDITTGTTFANDVYAYLDNAVEHGPMTADEYAGLCRVMNRVWKYFDQHTLTRRPCSDINDAGAICKSLKLAYAVEDSSSGKLLVKIQLPKIPYADTLTENQLTSIYKDDPWNRDGLMQISNIFFAQCRTVQEDKIDVVCNRIVNEFCRIVERWLNETGNADMIKDREVYVKEAMNVPTVNQIFAVAGLHQKIVRDKDHLTRYKLIGD